MRKEFKVEKLIPSLVEKLDAEMYYLRFAPTGWAILFLHEGTGAVSIQSDWGDWSHYWPPRAHGRTSLKAFLCEGDFDYLADKFMGRTEDEFDLEGTVKAIKKRIVEARWQHDLSKDDARELIEEAELMAEEGPVRDVLLDGMSATMRRLLGGEHWPIIEYRKPAKYLWLRDGVLPALVDELRRHLPMAAPEVKNG